MRKQKIWRVRVKKSLEDWIEVRADTPLQAESLAANIPNVLFVFGGSAIRGDRPIDQAIAVGVEDDD